MMAGPNGELDWHYEHWNDEMARESHNLLQSMGTILVGRITYEAMLKHWSQVAISPVSTTDDRNYARLICGLPKIVFSTTLHEITRPQSKLAQGNLSREVVSLKQQPGRDIISWGGVNMAHSLIQAGLVDIYLLWVAPVVLKQGVPLFLTKSRPVLKLVKTHHFTNGVVLFYYEPEYKLINTNNKP